MLKTPTFSLVIPFKENPRLLLTSGNRCAENAHLMNISRL